MPAETTKEILEKYSKKIEEQLTSTTTANVSGSTSREYTTFKKEMIPEIGRYERWAKSLGNIFKINVSPKDQQKIQKFLITAHLDVTPSQAVALSVLSMLSIFLGTILLTMAIFIFTGKFQLLLIFLGIIISLFVLYYTYGLPERLANSWKLRASSQMVPAVLYIVVYMKHTPNLEKAIEFASKHLEGPLALDLKKVFYDVEVGKYSSIKQSLDNYLEKWKEYAPEFVESVHLVESSLFEPSEERRTLILEKSLQVILDGVYEKMLQYSRGIRAPLTNIYMLGIILPTLTLALLPLASTLLGGSLKWPHVFLIFNIIMPFLVFYMTSQVLLKRPGGYGESAVLEMNPNYKDYISKKPWIKAGLISFPLFLIGLLPYAFYFLFNFDPTFEEIGLSFLGNMKIFDFKVVAQGTAGPFGPLAIILSLFIPLSIALFFIMGYKAKTSKIIKSRENTKKLEEEFTNSLFQLGNRLGDGTPAEIAFGKVAESTQGQITHDFFSKVNQNIQQSGMSLEKSIFDKHRGAIIFFPSALISTSMRILVEAVKKGLKVAAHSLISISEYVKNIGKINQRLRDLLAEIISDMKSNMTFLAPLLAGIVVGLSGMITAILNKLQLVQGATPGGGEAMGLGDLGNILEIFNVSTMMPPYFLQIIAGIYIIEIIFILTVALVTVDSGKDELKEKSELAKNLIKGTFLYLVTAFLSTLALSILAGVAIGGLA